jgi:DNA gyrase subunit A
MRVVIELKREAQAPGHPARPVSPDPPAEQLWGDYAGPGPWRTAPNPLREMLQAFLDFRETTLTRQYQHELDKIEARIHVVEGLLAGFGQSG